MKHNTIFNILKKLSSAYEGFCKPLCKELNVNQTSFDIIMFLANNPEYDNAKDITKVRGIKPNLVSFTVEKLVQEGLIERREVPGDRRKIQLKCTEKAKPLIESGHKIQSEFTSKLLKEINSDDMAIFERCIEKVKKNIEEI